MIVPEVFAPAGDRECLEAALRFGADAVYIGGKMFNMRASTPSFDQDGLADAVRYAHALGKKVCLTCNTVPTNDEADALPDFLAKAGETGVDAFIISDIGVLMCAKEVSPKTPVYMSVQTGIMNYRTANELYKLGARRVILARELDLNGIRTVRKNTPEDLELEVFVHGAICMSFSGRCLLSQYLTGRDANRGECSQPCRWKYALMEEKRPGEYFPIDEDERGSYILNAKDLCLIEHIDKLADAGVNSLKIEGRAKSSYYVSVITGAYRAAVDCYKKDPGHYVCPDWIKEEVTKVSHRAYSLGFLYGKPENSQYYLSGGYVRDWEVVGVVTGYDEQEKKVLCQQRNKFSVGDTVEILKPLDGVETWHVQTLFDKDNQDVPSVPHAMEDFSFPYEHALPVGSLLRIKV